MRPIRSRLGQVRADGAYPNEEVCFCSRKWNHNNLRRGRGGGRNRNQEDGSGHKCPDHLITTFPHFYDNGMRRGLKSTYAKPTRVTMTDATPAHPRSKQTINPALQVFKVPTRTWASMPAAWSLFNQLRQASTKWNSLFTPWTITWIWAVVISQWSWLWRKTMEPKLQLPTNCGSPITWPTHCSNKSVCDWTEPLSVHTLILTTTKPTWKHC